MKTFKSFVSELYHVPQIPVEKHTVNIHSNEGMEELNKNLSTAMAVDFSHPSEGMNKAKKVLSMYGIEIEHPEMKSMTKGVVSVPFSLASTHDEFDGPEKEGNETHVFSYTYNLKDGKFDTKAKVSKK